MTIQEFGMLYPRSEIKFKGIYRPSKNSAFEGFETELFDEPKEAFRDALGAMRLKGYDDEEVFLVEAVVIWSDR